jgi:hypothetical protein
MPYLRVLMDELFGRQNFIATSYGRKYTRQKARRNFFLKTTITLCVTPEMRRGGSVICFRAPKNRTGRIGIPTTIRAGRGSQATCRRAITTVLAGIPSPARLGASYQGPRKECIGAFQKSGYRN